MKARVKDKGIQGASIELNALELALLLRVLGNRSSFEEVGGQQVDTDELYLDLHEIIRATGEEDPQRLAWHVIADAEGGAA